MMFLIAKALDDQSTRLENLETALKLKFKEISYDQSRHLVGAVKSISDTAAFRVQTYTRELMVALQHDLVTMGK
jgi:hypothetical protein